MSENVSTVALWTAFRFSDLQTRTLAALERIEGDHGPLEISDDLWLTLVIGDLTILKVKAQLRIVQEAELTEALINMEARILLWRDNRRRRHWIARGCTHTLPAWATKEDRPPFCPWCGQVLVEDVAPEGVSP